MTTADDFADLLYGSAQQRCGSAGAIADASRTGRSVFIYGRPGGLLAINRTATAVQALVTDDEIRAIVLGGRPGIPVGKDLFTLSLVGQDLPSVANDTLNRIGQYLAASTG